MGYALTCPAVCPEQHCIVTMTQSLYDTQLNQALHAVRVTSRRRQILDAAITVMKRTGFHQMSMQALAEEAGISVGLIYRYFPSKQDILLATIIDILDTFSDQLEPVMSAVGDDPIRRFAAGFRRYVEVIDENLEAVILTYRESQTLDRVGRQRIKELEIATADPLREAARTAVGAGLMKAIDVDLAIFNAKILAHNWALKQWHLRPKFTIDTYITAQLDFILNAFVVPEQLANYLDLLE